VEPSQRTRAANCIVGTTTPLLLIAGLALAGWITTWAIYAWAARDAAWIASYSSATLLALALPVAFLVSYERWQLKQGLYDTASSKATKTLSWACGLLATLFGLLACPFILLSAYFAWMFWSDGLTAASVYFASVALAMLAEPVAFLFFYDRWQTRNGLQSPLTTTR
jgi:hypothetical protein